MSAFAARSGVLVLLLVAAEIASAQPAELSRDVGDYFALSFRRMRLKDFFVEAPGCNLGVNCQETGRTCGRLQTNGAVVNPPGQIVGDDMCGPGTFWEVFRNNTSATCSPDCSMIGNPGPDANCVSTFTAPILGDLDNDGQPSCGTDCDIDVGDVAVACGVQYPLPDCDITREVRVFPKSDCSPLEFDIDPGNGQCDLAAGVYGNIRVRNRGRINFGAGDTVACMVAVGKATRVTSAGPAVVMVPGSGKAAFNNLSDVGGDCRSFKVVTEFGPVRFAKHGEFHLDACTLAGTMKLGHDNNLRGRFIGGEFLVSNFNSTGACCEPTTTSTSTSTTTTSSTATSTTSTSLPDLPGICCEDDSEEPPICGSAETTQECLASGGTPGPAGSVCQADPEGGGSCTDGPPNPGGCCQLEGSCAIGGDIDEVTCASLGGAFVDDAVCDPDGNCVPTTTSTTVTTVTSITVTTVTTVTSITVTTATTTTTFATSSTNVTTTSTSTTTTPTLPGICCEITSENPPICGSAETTQECLAAGGTPGQPGSVCQADPEGGGRCGEGPPNPGGCCQLEASCLIGGDIDEITCASLGGAFVDDAVCTTDGRCTPTTTSTTTTSTVTSITVTSSTAATTITTTSVSVTTVKTTSTSSTTNTTIKDAVCCEKKDVMPWMCTSAVSVEQCRNQGGVPGRPGEVCQIGPQGGVCDGVPPPPGGCCQKPNQCSIGKLTRTQCENAGGEWVTDAMCLPDGSCVPTPDNGLGFTRTLGFYKTHPGVTQWILDGAGGLSVCGVELTNTDYDHTQSALEALCISPKGDQRLQLVRQLTAAALTMAAGGATFPQFDECNAFCVNGGSIYDLGGCINSADNFNNSGDYLPAPFDDVDSGHPEFCQIAHNTACNVLTPGSCTQ